jgi:hypothetical protein
MNRSGTLARRLAVPALCLASLLLAPPASAVVVELTDGQRIEGELRQASAARVLLDAGGQLLVFEADEVRAIYFSEAEPPPPPVRPSARLTRPEHRPPDPVQALSAVKALRAAIESGTSRPDYSPRVRRARAVVDRYLASSPEAPPPGAMALGEAMRLYQLAEFAWNNRGVASSIVWLQKDDALERCPGYGDFVEEMQAKGERHYSERTRSFLQISDGVLDVLWSCAAERIAEAEDAMPKPAAARPDAGPKAAAARTDAPPAPAAPDARPRPGIVAPGGVPGSATATPATAATAPGPAAPGPPVPPAPPSGPAGPTGAGRAAGEAPGAPDLATADRQ